MVMRRMCGIRRIGKSRKGQMFNLDVLVALIPVMLMMGASLQYSFDVANKAESLSRGMELSSVAGTCAGYIVTGSHQPPASPANCTDYVTTLSPSLAAGDYDFYFTLCPNSGTLDYNNFISSRNTTASSRRFVIDAYNNIQEMSFAVWRKPL